MSDRSNLEHLIGSAEGWDPIPTIDFLQNRALQTEGPVALLSELVDLLHQAGAPLTRIRLFFWTLHPLLMGHGYQWTREGGVEELGISHGTLQTDDYLGSPAEQMLTTRASVRYPIARDGLPDTAHPVLRALAASGMTDYYGIPMIGLGGRLEPIFIATDQPGGFTDPDIAKFDALARYLTPVIQALSHRQKSVELLETFIGKRSGRRVLEGRIQRGDGEVIDAALWFCDLRDFTELTETLPQTAMLDTLNSYFELIHAAVSPHGGEVLRFIGDAMLVIFPIDTEVDRSAACHNALIAAKDAFSLLTTLNTSRIQAKTPPIAFGLGLHVGQVVYGNVGAPSRLDFTVMGPAVNRTARLESLTKDTGHALLVSEEFSLQVPCKTEKVGDFRVKGIAAPLAAYTIAL